MKICPDAPLTGTFHPYGDVSSLRGRFVFMGKFCTHKDKTRPAHTQLIINIAVLVCTYSTIVNNDSNSVPDSFTDIKFSPGSETLTSLLQKSCAPFTRTLSALINTAMNNFCCVDDLTWIQPNVCVFGWWVLGEDLQ